MDVRIQISGRDEVTELTELRNWLTGERDLTGAVRTVRRPVGESEMGGAFDMLAVALGSSGVGVALAKSLTVWLQTRSPGVTIKVTTPSSSREFHTREIDDTTLPLLQEMMKPQAGEVDGG